MAMLVLYCIVSYRIVSCCIRRSSGAYSMWSIVLQRSTPGEHHSVVVPEEKFLVYKTAALKGPIMVAVAMTVNCLVAHV